MIDPGPLRTVLVQCHSTLWATARWQKSAFQRVCGVNGDEKT